MAEGLRFLKFVLTLMVVVGFLHASLLLLSSRGGISGYAVEGVPILFAPGNSVITWAILAGEWGLIIVVGLFFFLRRKSVRTDEMKESVALKNKIHLGGTATQIDNLYEVLKYKKSLRISTIEKLYGVSQELAMSWGKTLEAGNLAVIVYPRFGEPGLVYKNKSENPPEE